MMEIKPRFLGTDTARIERLSLQAESAPGVRAAAGDARGFDDSLDDSLDDRSAARVWVGNEAPAESCHGWLRAEEGDRHWCACVEEARAQRQAHALLFVGMSHVASTSALPTLHCLVDMHGRALTFTSEREMENYAIGLMAELQELP